jgi:hypothetical protein
MPTLNRLSVQLLIIALLVYGVMSDDIHINDPVLIPVLLQLVESMDRTGKGDDE